MAWIDEVNQLEDWLKNGNVDRLLTVRLFGMHTTGQAFYGEGNLDLGSNAIAGKVERYETKDRWDYFKEGGEFQIPDNLPFDPNRLEMIPVEINIATGAIKVHTLMFPNPEAVAGYLLASATSTVGLFGSQWHVVLSLHKAEIEIPK